MALGAFLMIKSLISLVFGLMYLFAPAALMAWFGLELAPAGVLIARMLGAVVLGISLVCWFTSQATESRLTEDVVLSLFCADTAALIVALLAQLAPTATPTGWIGVAILLLLSLGLGYFRFLR